MKTKPEQIHINTTESEVKLDRSVLNTIASCHAYLALREDYREQLRELQEEMKFNYLRCHGIFSDQMGVYREYVHGQPVFNFQLVDKVYDFFLSIGIRPFVELSFMPSHLASGNATCFEYNANVSMPKTMVGWKNLVIAFLKHCIERYGLREVRRWYFEVWNEPDISYFFDGVQKDYFALYKATADAVKSVNTSLRVGGPATSKNLWVDDFLKFCKKSKAPVDFVSTHHYCANTAIALNADGTKNRQYHGQPRMAQDIKGVREQIRASAFPKLELHYTEWNVTPFHVDSFAKDSEFTSVFALQTILDTQNLTNSYAFWAFSDVFEESGPATHPFCGLYGMINLHGIHKPVYHAFSFFSRLYPNRIAPEIPGAFVTTDKKGNFRILVWNFQDAVKPEFTGGDWKIGNHSRNLTLKLENVRGSYRVIRECTGLTAGNSFRAWKKIGSPQYLTQKQVAILRKKSKPLQSPVRTITAKGNLELKLILKPCDIQFIEIKP
ncbi:MAG: hypothetical protein JNL74_14505 [Fibrobacteres bacterium]|nr:hypothetical protein [Fibrobacterota bacterium]